MHVKYDISFILTYKLNQDFLENFFSILRLNGGTHDHPSPLQALQRIRLAILGKNLQHHLKRNQNTEDVSLDESFLVTNIFRKRKADCLGTQISINDTNDYEEDFKSWQVDSKNRTLEESDGMEYANGFIARSLLTDYPTLANQTCTVTDASEEGMNKENYVQDLSYGRLLQPTDAWSDRANKLDNYFNYMHNSTDKIEFRNKKDVAKRTILQFKHRFPEIPDKILSTYTNRRINIRVKHMQKRLQETKIHKYKIGDRKGKQEATGLHGNKKGKDHDAVVGKNCRKLKHLIT